MMPAAAADAELPILCDGVWKQLIGDMADGCWLIKGFIFTPLKPQAKLLVLRVGGVTLAQLL